MKKVFILAIMTVLFSSFVFAEETTIYNLVNIIRSNPSAYALVISSQAPLEDIKIATDLASFLGISSSRFDNEISNKQNLIIIGSPSQNLLVDQLIPEWSYGDNAIIKLVGSNLIISSKEKDKISSAILIIKDYEKNKEKLQSEEYIIPSFFSPNDSSFLILVVAAVIIIALILLFIFLITKKRKKIEEKLVTTNITQQDPNQQLTDYIKRSTQQGYSKEQIKQSLINVGWDASQVDQILNRF